MLAGNRPGGLPASGGHTGTRAAGRLASDACKNVACGRVAPRMRYGFILLTLAALLQPCLAGLPQTVEFAGKRAEKVWPLAELDPSLPADWSGSRFLTLEMRSSTPQRFELQVHTAGGMRMVRLQPFAGAWVRMSVPVAFFERPATDGHDLASLGNKPRAAGFVNLGGPYGPVADVRAVGVAMDRPVGSPQLEIRAVRLGDTPADEVLSPKPLVDGFGQWIPADWPGKARSADDLKAAWAAEDKALVPGDFGYGRYGGIAAATRKATGFFRVEKDEDGRWWFVDPDGHLFLSTGADCMGPHAETPAQGREAIFAALPPGGRRGGASPYTANLERRFGPDWRKAWVDLSLRRMEHWGLNTVANWSDPMLGEAGRKAYTVQLRGLGIEDGVLGLPDVFDPAWAGRVDAAAARQCGARKADPWLLGYFVGNEPGWPHRENQVAEMVLAGPKRPLQDALKAFLAEGDTPARRVEFVRGAFTRMLAAVDEAIHRHDPNHLVLGIRFGDHCDESVARLAARFDVFSLNIYSPAPDRGDLDKLAAATGRPILVGEFHIGTPGRGMAAGLVQAADQDERGVAYRYYMEQAMSHPVVIGAHWFQWLDQPSTGRFDGENYNIGFIDVTDRPYPAMVAAMRATHRRLADVHAGRMPPVDRKARSQ